MLNKNLALMTLVVFAAGCGIEARTYVMTKDRVGLEQGSGNGGCVIGKCPPATPAETTRKIYVLELTKPVPESEVQKIESTAVNAITDSVDTTATSGTVSVENTPAPADNPAPAATAPAVPVVGELPGTTPAPEPAAATTPEVSNAPGGTYTVLKDDTLQKISKKLFGTYSKWYKIYEANKDKIKNPNYVKPGTVLTIPVMK